MNPSGACEIRCGPRFAAFGQYLERDIRNLEGQAAHRADKSEHLAADLVGVMIVAPGMIQRHAFEGQARFSNAFPVHALCSYSASFVKLKNGLRIHDANVLLMPVLLEFQNADCENVLSPKHRPSDHC